MGIDALLNQTVTLNSRTGKNKYNEATFGSNQTIKARFEKVSKIIKGPQGEDIGTDAEVFLPLSVTVAEGDQITYDSVDYRVVRVDTSWDRANKHHSEVLLQRIT